MKIEARNNSLKQHVAFLCAVQKMREEMDRAWNDFFKKNPNEKEQNVRRWIEERSRKMTRFDGSEQESLIDYGQNALRKLWSDSA